MSGLIAYIPDARENHYQCGGGTMCVWRGARLYDVGGVHICQDCLETVCEALGAEMPELPKEEVTE